ncbi:hypothetical protein K8I61_04130 [bacterium]|nr:hypothetical protein [bacterium]
MAECFNRQMLRDLLNGWKDGRLTDDAMRAEALTLWNKYGVWINAPETDPRSITKSVLDGMRLAGEESMRFRPSDVDAILAFLNTPVGDEAAGWAAWNAYRAGERATA